MKRTVMISVVFAILTVASAAKADTTYTVKPGDTISQLLRDHGVTLGELKDANPGKIPGVCRSTKTVIGRFGTFTLCLRPRSYLVAGRTLTIPESRTAIEERAGQVEGLNRTIEGLNATVSDLQAQLMAQQETTQTRSSVLQSSKELSEARAEIASLKRKHARELKKVRADVSALRGKLARERREHSRAEETLEKALRAAKREQPAARVVVKRVPSQSYNKTLATALSIGLGAFALALLWVSVTSRRKNRLIADLQVESEKASQEVGNIRQELAGEREALQKELEAKKGSISIHELAAKDRVKDLDAKLAEAEQAKTEADKAKRAYLRKAVELDGQAMKIATERDGLQSKLQDAASVADRLRQETADQRHQLEQAESDRKIGETRFQSEIGRRAMQEDEALGSALEKQRAEYEATISDLRGQLNRTEIGTASLEDDKQSLEGELAQGRKLRQEQSSELESLRQHVARQGEQIALLAQGLEQLKGVKDENVRLNGELDVLRNQLEGFKKADADADALADAHLDWQKERSSLYSQLGEATKRGDELGARIQDLENGVERATRGVAELAEKRRRELDEVRESAEQEIAFFRKKAADAEAQPKSVPQPERKRITTPPLPLPAVSEDGERRKTPPPPFESLIEAAGAVDLTEHAELEEDQDQPKVGTLAVSDDLVRELTSYGPNPLMVKPKGTVTNEAREPFARTPSTAKMRVFHATDGVDVDLDAYFKVLPKSGESGYMCVWPGCEAIVARDEREQHLEDHRAITEIIPKGDNGAGVTAHKTAFNLEELDLRPVKDELLKAKTTAMVVKGIRLIDCPCGAKEFDKATWREHLRRGHLECHLCQPPVIIQSDHLSRHLKRAHPENIGASGKRRQSQGD